MRHNEGGIKDPRAVLLWSMVMLQHEDAADQGSPRDGGGGLFPLSMIVPQEGSPPRQGSKRNRGPVKAHWGEQLRVEKIPTARRLVQADTHTMCTWFTPAAAVVKAEGGQARGQQAQNGLSRRAQGDDHHVMPPPRSQEGQTVRRESGVCGHPRVDSLIAQLARIPVVKRGEAVGTAESTQRVSFKGTAAHKGIETVHRTVLCDLAFQRESGAEPNKGVDGVEVSCRSVSHTGTQGSTPHCHTGAQCT